MAKQQSTRWDASLIDYLPMAAAGMKARILEQRKQEAEGKTGLRLADFCAKMSPAYQRSAHTDLLCEYLERVERGEITRLAITMPPRHSKSYHVSQRFPAWYLGRHPDHQIILGSNTGSLAEFHSRRARNLLREPTYPFQTRLSGDSEAVSRWETSEGGIFLASGIGGTVTGFGAHVFILDDPIKDPSEADSESFRESLLSWYTEVAETRLMEGNAAIVLTMARWRHNDLLGELLDTDELGEWVILNLPAIAEEDDPMGRMPGEALWPERYPVERLEAIRSRYAARNRLRSFLALYQQRPTPEGGGQFKSEWFTRTYTELPTLKSKIQTIDGAFKTGVSNDYSVIATWGTDGVDYYLIDVLRRRMTYPDLKRAAIQQFQQHRPNAILIEDAASGHSLIQDMRVSSRASVIAVRPIGTKVSRADEVSWVCEGGKVVLPERARWKEEWIAEHCAFPNGEHDDQVDTTSMALVRLTSPRSAQMEHWGKVVPIRPAGSGNHQRDRARAFLGTDAALVKGSGS